MKQDTYSISLHCTCGAAWKGSGLPAHIQQRILEEWQIAHTGFGHDIATPEQACRARHLELPEEEES